MAYATVMVGLSVDQPNEACLEIAGQLAERLGARVIGIAAAEFSPPLYFTSGEQAQKLVDQGRAAIKNRVAEVESEFRAAMQNRVTEVEWRCAEDFPARYIVQQARASDIIVVGEATAPLPIPLCRSVQAISSCRRDGRCWSFPTPATGWICEASWSPGRIQLRRGGPSPMRCRCSVRQRMSRSWKSSRNKPIDRRRCPGSRMSRHGCRDTG
jgi:hypothetical protein